MASKEYIERLQMVIRHLHKCDAEHLETVPVKEVFRGRTIWEGDVEVFAVSGHPLAKKCYGWSYNEGKPDEHFTSVLELPPVKSAHDAVKVAIAAEVKNAK